jgi:DNA polymerase-4
MTPSLPATTTILHADLDAFYASVEQRDDPRLRGRPIIVGGGVVLAASYEAKALGVRTAMGGGQARRLCPEAVVVEPRFSAYADASRAVFEVFKRTTPLVEGLSIDEAFLDVRGLERISGTPVEIATRLRREVRERVGLPITVVIARTKFLAKVSSGVAKPDGLLVVPPDGELAFLHPLPVERLWGVGAVTARKLRRVGVTTVGQVARFDEPTLVANARARVGAPPPRVGPQPRPEARAGRSPSRLYGGAAGARQGAGVTRRPRLRAHRAGRSRHPANEASTACCRTVTLRMRFGDFSRATRSHTLPEATAQTHTLLDTARGLLATAMPLIAVRGCAHRGGLR